MGVYCVTSNTIHLSTDAIKESREQGFPAFEGNALSDDVIPAELASSVGHVLALTDNRDLNQLICEKWAENIDKSNLFRWSSHKAEVEQKADSTGIPVWIHLTKPSQISYEIKNKEIFFQQHTRIDENFKIGNSVFLMTGKKNKISFRMPTEFSGQEHFLIFDKVPLHLTGYISDKHLLQIQAQSYQEALSQTMQQARQLYPHLPFDEIEKQLLERELDFPTVLAHGVAAPHLHAVALTKPICLVVKIDSKIDLKTYDGHHVQLLFVLISPENEPEMHLRLLAEIAKIASNREVVENLLNTSSSNEFVKLISQEKS